MIVRLAAALGAALALAALGGCLTRPAVKTGACEDFAFPVYFKEAAADLTPAAIAALDGEAQRLKGCTLASVAVTGLSTLPSDAQGNIELSRARADVVTQALAVRGFPVPVLEVETAVVDARTASGARQPILRRTEVVVRFKR